MKATIFFVYFICVQAFTQNLVLNPSFEVTERCASYIGDFARNTSSWTTPTFGTTDLFNRCSKGESGAPINYNGIQEPQSGNNYAGVYLLSDDNYREYIQGELVQPLAKGKLYTISFYISLSENSDFAIKTIDVLFTDKKIKGTIHRELSKRQLKKMGVNSYNFQNITSNAFYNDRNDWIMLSKQFKATGGERFFTIGNFHKNSKTEKALVAHKNRFNMSYYYIDMVKVEALDVIERDPINQTIKSDKVTTKTNSKEILLQVDYVLENVIFNYNSIILSDEAKAEIELVYEFLTKNPATKIFISGHTDNIGSPSFNKMLSENRANSVAAYFIELGLGPQRMFSRGYGDLKPIESNTTEEGRERNRRVTFYIVE